MATQKNDVFASSWFCRSSNNKTGAEIHTVEYVFIDSSLFILSGLSGNFRRTKLCLIYVLGLNDWHKYHPSMVFFHFPRLEYKILVWFWTVSVHRTDENYTCQNEDWPMVYWFNSVSGRMSIIPPVWKGVPATLALPQRIPSTNFV